MLSRLRGKRIYYRDSLLLVGELHWRQPLEILLLFQRSMLQEHRNHLGMAVFYCSVQRRVAVGYTSGIDVC